MRRKYEPAVRTGGRRSSGYSARRKKGAGGTVAAVLAILLVFAAGFLIGNTAPVGRLLGDASSGSSAPSASSDASSAGSEPGTPGAVELPDGLTLAVPPSSQAPSYDVGAVDSIVSSNYIVIDRLSGAVLLERGGAERIYPASTTKIMTAALALETAALTDTLAVTPAALGLLSSDAASIGLLSGETDTLEELLYATLLASACDAANVVADQLGGAGGFSGYVSGMVARAKEIGCTGTYFVNPSGIHSSAHFSTVSDLARMACLAGGNPAYRAILSADRHLMRATELHPRDGWACAQNDFPAQLRELLAGTGVTDVTGVKSGTTAQGGYSMVCTAVTSGGRELVAVLSGLPYDGGRGAAQRVPDMAALLREGARLADAAAGTSIVAAGEALPAALSGGVDSLLPEGKILTPARSLSLTTAGDGALSNGDAPIFYAAGDFTAEAVYYNDLADRIRRSENADEVVAGVLHIRAGEAAPVDDIPLVIRTR